MKLELKHLAPYLPYELKYIFGNNTYIYRNTIDFDYEYSKPILRPLSDITDNLLKQFYTGTSEGEIIISNYVAENSKDTTMSVSYKMMGEPFTDIIINRNSIELTDYWIVTNLLELHFDVFGLIDKGLAIDINTLTQE